MRGLSRVWRGEKAQAGQLEGTDDYLGLLDQVSPRCPEFPARRNARIFTAGMTCETISRHGSAVTETGL